MLLATGSVDVRSSRVRVVSRVCVAVHEVGVGESWALAERVAMDEG